MESCKYEDAVAIWDGIDWDGTECLKTETKITSLYELELTKISKEIEEIKSLKQ